MARKKADVEEVELNVDDQIISEHGEVLLSADQFFAREKPFVSISPAWDYGTGGGIPVGSWVTLNGKAKAGKTSTLMQFIANAQNQLGMKGIIVPVEGRLKLRDQTNIHNLITSPDALQILFSTEQNILSAEKQLEILDSKLRSERRLIVLIDSFSLLMEEDRHAEFGKSTRGKLGQLLSAFCARNAHVVPLREHIIMGVTHTVANTGNSMSTRYEKLPSSIAYQNDVKANHQWMKDPEWIRNNEQIGLCVKWKIETHAGIVPINREFVSRFLFNYGISHEAEILDFAIDLGIIVKKGAWYSYGNNDDGNPALKSQGWDNLFDSIRQEENQHIYQEIKQKVNNELKYNV